MVYTNAQIRHAVVRELNDIDTKLDGLSRKDLLRSYSFLEEGVQLLNVSGSIEVRAPLCIRWLIFKWSFEYTPAFMI